MASKMIYLLKECTVDGVSKDFFLQEVTLRRCLLQECTLFGIKKDMSVTGRDAIWGQKGILCYKESLVWGQ
jgi:hypothetical protein